MAYLVGIKCSCLAGSMAPSVTLTPGCMTSAPTPDADGPAGGPSARAIPEMASLGGDQALLFGGVDAAGYDDETWVYDLSANTWTNHSLPPARPHGDTMPWPPWAGTRYSCSAGGWLQPLC